MWPYSWTHVGTPSHLGHMDRLAATMPSQAHAGAAQEAPNIGQWEGQDVPLVRPSSCIVKGGIPSSRRYLPTYLRGMTRFPIVIDRLTVEHRGCTCIRFNLIHGTEVTPSFTASLLGVIGIFRPFPSATFGGRGTTSTQVLLEEFLHVGVIVPLKS